MTTNTRQTAMEWWNNLAHLTKTQICDTSIELIGYPRRWETLTGREIESLWNKIVNGPVLIEKQ